MQEPPSTPLTLKTFKMNIKVKYCKDTNKNPSNELEGLIFCNSVSLSLLFFKVLIKRKNKNLIINHLFIGQTITIKLHSSLLKLCSKYGIRTHVRQFMRLAICQLIVTCNTKIQKSHSFTSGLSIKTFHI